MSARALLGILVSSAMAAVLSVAGQIVVGYSLYGTGGGITMESHGLPNNTFEGLARRDLQACRLYAAEHNSALVYRNEACLDGVGI